MNLPDQVAVMPLPNAILFPRVLLPLYIFEPRYQQMLDDCLKTDRMFAVALLRPGQSNQPYPVAGVGVIRNCVRRPDGTAHLILEGVARVQIVAYAKLRPYRVARIEALETVHQAPPAPRAQLEAAITQLVKARAQLGAKLPKPVVESLLAVESSDVLTDLVSYTLLEDFHQKQQMLETLDINLRLDKLVTLLQRQIQQFELWKTLRGNLSHDDVGKN